MKRPSFDSPPEGFRVLWFSAQLLVAFAMGTAVVLIAREKGIAPVHVSLGPVVWGAVAALVHSLHGLALVGPASAKRPNLDKGIRGGLIVLALRFLSGVGLLVAGLLAFPSHRTLCVASWFGSFLLLTFLELVFFVKGVKRL